jgi:hypothetical protein
LCAPATAHCFLKGSIFGYFLEAISKGLEPSCLYLNKPSQASLDRLCGERKETRQLVIQCFVQRLKFFCLLSNERGWILAARFDIKEEFIAVSAICKACQCDDWAVYVNRYEPRQGI